MLEVYSYNTTTTANLWNTNLSEEDRSNTEKSYKKYNKHTMAKKNKQSKIMISHTAREAEEFNCQEKSNKLVGALTSIR